MSSRNYSTRQKLVTALAYGTRSSAAVQSGAAIDLTDVVELKFVLDLVSRTDGSTKIQDIQFANDSSFSVNVSTYTANADLIKNNSSSSTSAIDQTSLAAAGKSAVSIENKAINGQKYARVRTSTTVGDAAVNLVSQVVAIVTYSKSPVIQS
jgi:hypothetical protein